MEDSGGFPIELNTANFKMGDSITINPYEQICISNNGNNIDKFEYKTPTFLDSVRVGGRINLIIGKSLSLRSQEFLNKSNMKNSIQIPWSDNKVILELGLFQALCWTVKVKSQCIFGTFNFITKTCKFCPHRF